MRCTRSAVSYARADRRPATPSPPHRRTAADRCAEPWLRRYRATHPEVQRSAALGASLRLVALTCRTASHHATRQAERGMRRRGVSPDPLGFRRLRRRLPHRARTLRLWLRPRYGLPRAVRRPLDRNLPLPAVARKREGSRRRTANETSTEASETANRRAATFLLTILPPPGPM